MASPLKQHPLIAVDTNVPLDLAADSEPVLDALALIRKRLKPGRILLPPTVFQELVYIADQGDTAAGKLCKASRAGGWTL